MKLNLLLFKKTNHLKVHRKFISFMMNIHSHFYQVNFHSFDIPIFEQTLTDWNPLLLTRYRPCIW